MASSTDSKDQSNAIRWVVVQLSPTGEKEPDVDILKESARKILKREDIEIFVPAITPKVRDDSQTIFFMEGYVFFQHVPGIPYLRLRDTAFFSDVLCTSSRDGEPSFHLLDDSELDSMRAGMDELRTSELIVGDTVKVVDGNYKNLTGEISTVYDGGTVVQVAVILRSKQMLIDFPTTYVEKVQP